jgi:hypothetical protein
MPPHQPARSGALISPAIPERAATSAARYTTPWDIINWRVNFDMPPASVKKSKLSETQVAFFLRQADDRHVAPSLQAEARGPGWPEREACCEA